MIRTSCDVTCFNVLFTICVWRWGSPEDIGACGLDGYFNAGIATHLLIAARHKPHSVKNAFLNKFAIHGTLLFHESEGLKSAKLVVDSTASGIVLWPLLPVLVNGQRSYKIDVSKIAKPTIVHILDPKGWLCQHLEVLAPASCKDLVSENKPCGIRLAPLNSKLAPFIRFSCDNGFPDGSVHDLKELVYYLEVPCDSVPSVEIDLVTLLVKYIRPMSPSPPTKSKKAVTVFQFEFVYVISM